MSLHFSANTNDNPSDFLVFSSLYYKESVELRIMTEITHKKHSLNDSSSFSTEKATIRTHTHTHAYLKGTRAIKGKFWKLYTSELRGGIQGV